MGKRGPRAFLRMADWVAGILALAVVASCAGKRVARVPELPPPQGGSWSGLASWYGVPYHGRQTASGEVYNMHDLTAAHLTLPFGSQVQVTHLRNGKTVRVKINDRGPFVEDRIIDLSYAAARSIDMVEDGVAPVRLRVEKEGAAGGDYTVQVGAFLSRDNAERFRDQLSRNYRQAYIDVIEAPPGTFYRVRVGSYPDRQTAERAARQLQREGHPTFITRADRP